jgi:hypothetical protein
MKKLAEQLVAFALGLRDENTKLAAQIVELQAQIVDRDETITVLRDGLSKLEYKPSQQG